MKCVCVCYVRVYVRGCWYGVRVLCVCVCGVMVCACVSVNIPVVRYSLSIPMKVHHCFSVWVWMCVLEIKALQSYIICTLNHKLLLWWYWCLVFRRKETLAGQPIDPRNYFSICFFVSVCVCVCIRIYCRLLGCCFSRFHLQRKNTSFYDHKHHFILFRFVSFRLSGIVEMPEQTPLRIWCTHN